SLKDMSIIGRAGELRELGVSALKIEGRMKRPEYVAAAVTACRKALAGEPVDLETLQSVFSRSGFTDGYFEGRLGAEMFGIRQKEDVTAAAGVLGGLETLYTDPRKQVQKVEADFRFTSPRRHVDGDNNIPKPWGSGRRSTTPPIRRAAASSKTGGPLPCRSVSCEIGKG
ncbi:MAG: U32 family peptidase, partial [Anaerotruncus massiliensis (ex Togo et al. 2019)]